MIEHAGTVSAVLEAMAVASRKASNAENPEHALLYARACEALGNALRALDRS